MNRKRVRVVLADDHRVFLQGLTTLLESAGIDVVGMTDDRDGLLELIDQQSPDVAIVDIGMPGVTVPELLAVLQEKRIPTRVLVLTASAEPNLAVEMLAAGVRGYVLKEHAFEDLDAAIRSVSRGKSYVSPQLARKLLMEQQRADDAIVLTDRQLEVLRLVAEGMTSKTIASRLGIHLKTVDNHRQRLREKLSVHSSVEMIRVATERGLV